jgi:hypothetical protein
MEALGDAQKIGIDGVDALADAAELVGKINLLGHYTQRRFIAGDG